MFGVRQKLFQLWKQLKYNKWSHLGKYEKLAVLLRPEVDEPQIEEIFNILKKLPRVEVKITLTTIKGEILPFENGIILTVVIFLYSDFQDIEYYGF